MQPHTGSELQKRSSHCTSDSIVRCPHHSARQNNGHWPYNKHTTQCAHTHKQACCACKSRSGNLTVGCRNNFDQSRAALARQEVPGGRTSLKHGSNNTPEPQHPNPSLVGALKLEGLSSRRHHSRHHPGSHHRHRSRRRRGHHRSRRRRRRSRRHHHGRHSRRRHGHRRPGPEEQPR